MYIETGREIGNKYLLEQRAADNDLDAEIEAYLKNDDTILREIGFIEQTTIDKILLNVRNAIETGATVTELQQAIIDSGIMSASRAMMLSRTLTGMAANLGQLKSAELGGAKSKTWETAGFEVRKTHQAMDGVTVGIDDYFIVGGKKAMFPLDSRLPPAEKVNCRCAMTFGMDAV
jgi:uncharacterized protein with gpF-like domain